ncbi:uncharacterized protein SPPG_02143 [Spizellomyces punctatus DAOM BR117]|uniref:GATA-type domain-containing protein n=1 Tax=Spizellomyces punctatus (strain DAOM BR117) TaxID=645134 RepID=A0A0L0HPX7_SPIPD|nr:uncharacterized protein SPPG_02143 [Spizellomyces punctatus DAOM BR117]KND03078.1 hypothetical protein SPPG_02143 [Spizellomyces punctatus DAOM BR117]|eukprot:XP_016611117.1 hypothetical protein SPPG_02143 [Spizellomyces punctatus DAOM BR117]
MVNVQQQQEQTAAGLASVAVVKPVPSLYERKYGAYGAQRFSPLLHHSSDHRRPPVDKDVGKERSKHLAQKAANKCANCGTMSTPLWRRGPKGEVICNACGLYLKARNTYRPTWLKQRRPKKEGDSAQAAPPPSLTSSNNHTIERAPTSLDALVTIAHLTTHIPQLVPVKQEDGLRPNVSTPFMGDTLPDAHIKQQQGCHSGLGRPPGPGREHMQCINCSTTSTPLWRRDDKGNAICNACGLYYKLHHTHRPVTMKRAVIKRRKRVTPNSGAVLSPYETSLWSSIDASADHGAPASAADAEHRRRDTPPQQQQQQQQQQTSEGRFVLPPLKSILPMGPMALDASPASSTLSSSSPPAMDAPLVDGSLSFRMLPSPFANPPPAAARSPYPTSPATQHEPMTVNSGLIQHTRAELVNEIDRLKTLLSHKAGILVGLDQAERFMDQHAPQPFGNETVRLPPIREAFDLQRHEGLEDAEASATQALMSLATGAGMR